MRASWSASVGCSPSGVPAWILGVKGGLLSLATSGGWLLIPSPSDVLALSQGSWEWNEAAIWKVKQLNFRLISAFSPLPFLSHALLLLKFREQRCSPASYREMSKYMPLPFKVLTCCVNVANNTPNKKGKHYYPYCKYVRSAGGFLERRFPWLVTVNTLTLPVPSP